MLRKLAALLRRLAERLDPTPKTIVDVLMPRARQVVAALADRPAAGSIKWVIAMKALERELGPKSKARRRHINAAIDRAVLEQHGD